MKTRIVDENALVTSDPDEGFNRVIVDLLFAFKDAAGESEWLTVKGSSNNEKFCIAIAVNERAEELERITTESFLDEDRN